jgi:hypothetical protein
MALAQVAGLDRDLGAPGDVGLEVGYESLEGFLDVLAGSGAHADLGPGDRDELIDRLGDRRRVDGED